jgi:hypothetical protein
MVGMKRPVLVVLICTFWLLEMLPITNTASETTITRDGRAGKGGAPLAKLCTDVASIMEQGYMNAEEFHTIAVGDIISYTLSPDQRPTNPLRAYRGVVTKLYPATYMVIVTLLDEGYEGLSEQVQMDQIQGVIKG